MDIGDKIRSFRLLRGMSQKSLAENSGVSEGAIRKYEAGTRIPKTVQLKKLALALGISEIAFLDVSFDLHHVETVGDAFALFFELEKNIGVKFSTIPDKESKNCTSEISLSFNNPIFNSYLSEWLPVKKHLEDTINSRDRFEIEEEYYIAVQAAQALCEYKKAQLVECNFLLNNND